MAASVGSVSGKEGRRGERTEREILLAAARLLIVDRGASMQEIAAAAGVGRTTLHRYFPSREALIRAIAMDALGECEAAIEKSRIGEGSVEGALQRLFEELVPIGERYHFLLAEAELDDDPEYLSAEEKIDAPICGLIERGRRDGTFRADVPTAWIFKTVETLLFAAWEGVRAGKLAPRDTPRLATETLLHGLGKR